MADYLSRLLFELIGPWKKKKTVPQTENTLTFWPEERDARSQLSKKVSVKNRVVRGLHIHQTGTAIQIYLSLKNRADLG